MEGVTSCSCWQVQGLGPGEVAREGAGRAPPHHLGREGLLPITSGPPGASNASSLGRSSSRLRRGHMEQGGARPLVPTYEGREQWQTQSPVHCAHSRSHTHRHTRTHAQTRVHTHVRAHTCTLTLTLACSRGHVKMRPRRWATCPPTPGGGRPRAALRPRKPVGPGRRPCKACRSRPGLQPPGE